MQIAKQIDDNLIAYLEELSYLILTQEEKIQIKEDMVKIIDHMSVLANLDTVGVAECSHPLDNVNDFRDDVLGEPFDRELILKNAPMRNDETFIAPKTVD